MPPLETALRELRQILSADCTAPEWRWHVRRHLSEVKEALAQPQGRSREAWLTARSRLSDRHRFRLHARVVALSGGVLDKLDSEEILHATRRLLADLEHHQQRLHDLVYDGVSCELGGSE